eukprot:1993461-Rhodomonas_salina.1
MQLPAPSSEYFPASHGMQRRMLRDGCEYVPAEQLEMVLGVFPLPAQFSPGSHQEQPGSPITENLPWGQRFPVVTSSSVVPF